MTDDAEWRPIPGFENAYAIARDGRVRSLDRIVVRSNGVHVHRRGCTLKPGTQNPSGLTSVSLWREGKKYGHYVHKLMAQAWNRQIVC